MLRILFRAVCAVFCVVCRLYVPVILAVFRNFSSNKLHKGNFLTYNSIILNRKRMVEWKETYGSHSA